jgi:wyosine [tRNA(Phe)-imidazoG37] synthetase (radical SAM superfamily)
VFDFFETKDISSRYMSAHFKYLFGPVASRRFGLSLGVDLLPQKVCSFDCVFCEVGRTLHRTIERKEYVPTREVIKELRKWKALKIPADVITVAGSGEPTLHIGFGEIIDEINSWQSYPSLLLTNSSLMFLPEVRKEALKAKIVKASLSAFDQQSFNAICRPHPELVFTKILEGLHSFRNEFKGKLWLEVFIVPGINDATDAVKNIARLIKALNPDKVQLNTAIRPAAESFVKAADGELLKKLATLFEPAAEVIGFFNFNKRDELEFYGNEKVSQEAIIKLIGRRPCSLEEIALALNAKKETLAAILETLLENKAIRQETRNNGTYYYI